MDWHNTGEQKHASSRNAKHGMLNNDGVASVEPLHWNRIAAGRGANKQKHDAKTVPTHTRGYTYWKVPRWACRAAPNG